MTISCSSPTTIGVVVSILAVTLAYESTNHIQSNNSPSSLVSPRIIYAESHGISWSDLGLPERLPPLLKDTYSDVISIDYHYNYSYIIYSSSESIWRLIIDKNGVVGEPVKLISDVGDARVAVDWVRDRIYWVTSGENLLVQWTYLIEPYFYHIPEVIMTLDVFHLPKNSNIVLDPYSRILFLIKDYTTIMSVLMDGGGYWEVGVTFEIGERMDSLAIDTHEQRLYVSTVLDYTPRLWSCEYDGTNIQVYDLSTKWWSSFVSIAVFRGQLFWVHHRLYEKDTVWKANMSGNGSLTWEEEYKPPGTAPVDNIWAMRVYHPDIQTPRKTISEHVTRDTLDVTRIRPRQPVLSNGVTISINVVLVTLSTVCTNKIV